MVRESEERETIVIDDDDCMIPMSWSCCDCDGSRSTK